MKTRIHKEKYIAARKKLQEEIRAFIAVNETGVIKNREKIFATWIEKLLDYSVNR